MTSKRIKRNASEISQEFLKSMLRYDEDSGQFIWLVNRRAGAFAGREAGTVKLKSNGRRYREIFVCGRAYGVHRLAWLYMTGAWPVSGIDHKDTDGCNNRWDNLRSADASHNIANAKVYSTNTSGKKGVTWHRQCRRWQGQIKKDGRTFYLGLFESIDEAHGAYMTKAKELFGEFARAA